MAGIIMACNGGKFKPVTKNYHSFLVAEILNSTDNDAMRVLDLLGGIPSVQYIKHYRSGVIGKCSIYDIADLYEVKHDYLQRVYYNSGITKTTAPRHIDFVSCDSPVLQQTLIGYPSNCRGVSLYSPRIALATAVILDTRNEPYKNEHIENAYCTIFLSEYGLSANRAYSEFCKRKLSASKKAKRVECERTILASKESGEKLVVDMSLLKAIIDSLANA